MNSELRTAVLHYLHAIAGVNRVGTPELSHYTALDNLFDALGDQLKPKVRAVVHYAETTSGQPDLGLFSADQPQPDRGVVEVKGSDHDLDALIASEQVDKYWRQHKLVLCTNLRAFALVGEDRDGSKAVLERYSLADTDADFTALLKHPTAAANRHGLALGQYLTRVMTHQAAIADPRDLARLLAAYAQAALQRVEQAAAAETSLDPIREALEQALGMRYEDARGQDFFRSTLVQTLFYGIFTAWVLSSRADLAAGKTDRFRWWDTAYRLRAPVLRMLFHHLTDPGRLERLNLTDVLDWTEAALDRVDREEFLKRFYEGEAVQYFYEPFLEAFDPDLRKQLGVWYTPRAVVRYMVARVDQALRDDLKIPKGLADERVYVLDPCCGTGAFLIETLRRIAQTELATGQGAAAPAAARQAATTRIFGFEIMPAPLVVAHLEIGLALEQLGAALEPNQRAGVFLTNALIGWEPETTKPMPFPELEHERQQADAVKQEQPILVILGNPPYSGFAGVAVDEERELSDAYRQVNGPDLPKPQGQGLNDLYVRFFRMAERRIADKTGEGVVCFISNYSWLDGLSFPGMRQRYLHAFDDIRIDNLNGDKYRTGKLTPDGDPDPSIFSTPDDPLGIQVGTAVATLIRKQSHQSAQQIDWRELWGVGKLQELDETAESEPSALYQPIAPTPGLGLPFTPVAVSDHWFDWPSLVDLFPAYYPGVKTSRDSLVVDIDLDQLKQRIAEHVDAADTDFIRYAYRPFDLRWLYWSDQAGLLDRPRPEYQSHVFAENLWLEAREREPQSEYQRGTVVRAMADNFGNGLSSWFPLYLRDLQFDLESDTTKRVLNLSDRGVKYVESLDAEPENLFYHVVATLHDPKYRAANADPLRLGWPRIPLPGTPEALAKSAAKGRQLARLLDTESDVSAYLDHTIAVPTTTDGTQMQPDDFALTANWGRFGANQAVMPGRGKIVKHGQAVDIYLNDKTYWANVPLAVWEYRLGGYQVLKKWLSYREEKVLGRPLTVTEVAWFSETARRIAALLKT